VFPIGLIGLKPMIIRLDRLGDEPFEWQEEITVPSDELEHPDLLAVGEITVVGKVSRSANGFFLRAALSYDQTSSCTRCLGEVADPVQSELDLLVLVRRDEMGSEELELDEDDLGVLVLDEPKLDTRPLVEEQVQLEVPMSPVCSPDCAGLCPHCGADLNAGPCGCQKEVDPRWAALAGLVDDSK